MSASQANVTTPCPYRTSTERCTHTKKQCWKDARDISSSLIAVSWQVLGSPAFLVLPCWGWTQDTRTVYSQVAVLDLHVFSYAKPLCRVYASNPCCITVCRRCKSAKPLLATSSREDEADPLQNQEDAHHHASYPLSQPRRHSNSSAMAVSGGEEGVRHELEQLHRDRYVLKRQ
jgi:hypothetical protein